MKSGNSINMTKVFRVKRKDVLEALDEIDRFMEKMDLFLKEHPGYSYKLEIKKTRRDWEIYLTIDKDD